MKEGILIIATRSSIYGRMAYNLALTIKATGTKIPVAIICDESAMSHLNDQHKKMFDVIIPSTDNWNQIRFNVDKLTPFDFTMQLDADVLWLWKDPAVLFEQHKNAELLVTNEGYYDIESKTEKLTGGYFWLADRDETVKRYKLKGKMYQMRWEALMFKKTDKVRKMFAKAEEIYKKPKLETWKFEGKVVDEFCFYVAACIFGLDQIVSPWLPVYWKSTHPQTIAEMNKTHYAVGFGGNTATTSLKNIYDTIMGAACFKLGLRHTFKLQSKSQHIPERKTV